MRRGVVLAVVAAWGAAAGGCVERVLAVRSEPPGAVVYLDGEKIGTSPCEIRYEWYGTRELAVELAGHRLVREMVTLSPPWWQIFPLDFVTDVLIPVTIHDRVELQYRLEPVPVTRDEVQDVLRRAQELRRRAGPPPP